jgi:hypothetical protein
MLRRGAAAHFSQRSIEGVMYDQLRPPTDNLYKFWALAGLAWALFAAYMNTTRDIKLATIYWQSDEARYAVDRLNAKYDDQIWNIDEDVHMGHYDAATGKTRKTEVARKRSDALAKQQKEYRDTRDAGHKFNVETHYQYITLFWSGWAAGVLSFVAFVFWYFKLQRPLDEIMMCDLRERRLRAQKMEASAQSVA